MLQQMLVLGQSGGKGIRIIAMLDAMLGINPCYWSHHHTCRICSPQPGTVLTLHGAMHTPCREQHTMHHMIWWAGVAVMICVMTPLGFMPEQSYAVIHYRHTVTLSHCRHKTSHLLMSDCLWVRLHGGRILYDWVAA